MAANNTLLRLEQVSFSPTLGSQVKHAGYPILHDISFDVKTGDAIAIVGATGAGKTSLLRLLNRLSDPTGGKIYLENQEYRQIPILQLRQQVVLLAQEPKLLGMTAQEALEYPLVLRGLPKQTIQQRLSHWLGVLRIPDDLLARTEVQLSAGQRQLIAIARALLTEPKILLLDEPTSALDAGTATRVVEILTSLVQSQQTTILMVNHQLKLAQKFCTRLLYIQEGRIHIDKQAAEIDWEQLQENLMQAQAKAAEEWI